MILEKLILENFRNIEFAELEFCEKTNVIIGENANGKTNLLEALWCFTGGKSFRGGKDGELISLGKEKALLSLDFFDDGRKQNCKIFIDKKKTAVLNDVEYPNTAILAGKISAFVFSPSDLNIVKDGPIYRRRFLDSAVFRIYPAYAGIYKRYLRALEQRNKILKEIKYDPGLEEFICDFEKELAETGTEIINYRKKFINELSLFLPEIYGGISSGKEKLTAEYLTFDGETKEDYIKALYSSRTEDMKTLSTSVGPHRDDLELKIDGLSVRSFSSQGQKRSAALSLKLAESEVIKKNTGKQPVALLDDVFSELDVKRQNYILNHLGERQIFITCCDPGNIKGLNNGKIIKIENGKVI